MRKKGTKQEWKKEKANGDKKTNQKRRKDNKTLSQKREKGTGKNPDKRQ
jgi:hypothetical protein